MHRELSPGIYWIQECHGRSTVLEDRDEKLPDWYDPTRECHTSVYAYLLKGEQTLLYDTTSPLYRDHILEELSEILDGQSLDYLLPSHTDLPHAANTNLILDAYPECELLSPGYSSSHELYHLGDATKVSDGDQLDLGGFEITFYESVFTDAPISIWMKEETTNTLFSADWMSYPHMAGDCLKFSDEMDPPGPTTEQLAFLARAAMFWFEFADAEKVERELEYQIEKLSPDVIAPAHGNVIRKDAVETMKQYKPLVRRVAVEGKNIVS